MSSRRPGFTLVELLVVIAIIGILVALLLPAVQAAREASRRSSCSNHLKQFALAVQNYHDGHRALPVNIGPWSEGSQPAPQRNGKGWIVSILPHLEQQVLFDSFVPGFDGDFFSSSGILNPVCSSALKTRFNVLHCPSDATAANNSTSQFQLGGIEVVRTSYKGVIGDTRMGGASSVHQGTMPDCHSTNNCNGLFYRNSYQDRLRMASITDGTSQTFLIGEDVVDENNHSAAYYANGDYASCHAPPNYFPKPPTPNDWWNVMSFRSRHPGGVQFAFVDASVTFINETINHALYRALSTKAGGEPVGRP
jgi:prepilin-type N-terminal cleavage/methylation domain-containing protein/prepilin-type processing-associated H-X9-DG protein